MSPMMWRVDEERDLFPNFIVDNFIFNPNWNGSKLIQKGESIRMNSHLVWDFFLLYTL